MRFRWLKNRPEKTASPEAQQAVKQASRHHREAHERRAYVDALTLKAIAERERNHFGEAIALSMSRPKGA